MNQRSYRGIDGIVHVAVPKPMKAFKWDVECMGWLEGRKKSEEIHDEVPTCLRCIALTAHKTNSFM